MNNNSWTFKSLFEELCYVEKKYKLFQLKVSGVYVWKLIRFLFFMELCNLKGLYDDSHPDLPKSKSKIKNLLNKLYIGHTSSAWTAKRTYSTLIFPHARKKKCDGVFLDAYTYDFYQNLNSFDKNETLIVDRPERGQYYNSVSDFIKYDEPLNVISFIKRSFDRITGYNTTEFEKLFQKIHQIANINISTFKTLNTKNIYSAINKFNFQYSSYLKLFKKLKVKQIFIVVSYFNEGLIAAAQELGITVTEFQHGTITGYHVGYSFPTNIPIPYFPDRLILWGEYWQESTKLPISRDKISISGYQHIEDQLNSLKKVETNPKRVLFISQGNIAKKLFPFAITLSEMLTDFEIVYRLHPSENKVWKEVYPTLKDAVEKNRNLKIELSNEKPLYDSFSETKFVVGAFSTALIEALAVGCKLVFINLPGVEYFQYLFDNNLFPLVSNNSELELLIKNDFTCGVSKEYFFKTPRKESK